MRIFKKVKPLCFILIVCILNGVMSFMMEPAMGASTTMWSEYYQEQEIDTIFVGPSFCSATFDPHVFDETMDVKSFNMGTSSQIIEQSISAIKTASMEHRIHTVVYGMGFYLLQEEANVHAELTFEHARAKEEGGVEGFCKSVQYVFSSGVRGTEKSLNYWFPWIYNKEEVTTENIRKNVQLKLDIIKQIFTNEKVLMGESQKGYRFYEGILNEDIIWSRNSYNVYGSGLKNERLKLFEELIQVCQERNINLIVINTPHPPADVISCYEMYQEYDEQVKSLCDKYNVDYYNFSLVKPEVFSMSSEYFYDFEHLNYEGSQEFCHVLCDILNKKRNGENLEGYFYTYEEFIEQNTELLEEWQKARVS